MVRFCFICRESKPASESLLRFPSNKERLAEWIQFCKMPPYRAIADNKKLCSVHFEEKYFINPSYKQKGLRPEAVPSLYPTGVNGPKYRLGPYKSYTDDTSDHTALVDYESWLQSSSDMTDEPTAPQKTVPPLRIKNVRSLQTVHISDEESPLSVDTGSTSETDNLIIDETELSIAEGESLIIETGAAGDVQSNRRSRKRTRKPKPSAPKEDRILVIDGDTIGSDELEQDAHSSFRLSSNRHSINSDESLTPSRLFNTSSQSSKGSRRKSHHVPKQVGDVVFEEATILTVDDDDDIDGDDGKTVENKEEHRNDPNRNLMKNIAMLRTCINYVLAQQNYRPFPFKHNFESTASMIEYYNVIKSNRK